MTRVTLTAGAQAAVAAVLAAGDLAVDATVGNGHDTLFLARCVGEEGAVYGFDLQPQALEQTRGRLESAGLAGRVRLEEADHGRLADHLPPEARGRVKAVMFNLGYLPGSDKACITRPASTRAALDQALQVLAPGGLISVLAYTGHPGGREEADEVRRWSEGLDAQRLEVRYEGVPEARGPAPELTLIRRR